METETDPDRKALDADPDPPKCCRPSLFRIHNTAYFQTDAYGGLTIPSQHATVCGHRTMFAYGNP